MLQRLEHAPTGRLEARGTWGRLPPRAKQATEDPGEWLAEALDRQVFRRMFSAREPAELESLLFKLQPTYERLCADADQRWEARGKPQRSVAEVAAANEQSLRQIENEGGCWGAAHVKVVAAHRIRGLALRIGAAAQGRPTTEVFLAPTMQARLLRGVAHADYLAELTFAAPSYLEVGAFAAGMPSAVSDRLATIAWTAAAFYLEDLLIAVPPEAVRGFEAEVRAVSEEAARSAFLEALEPRASPEMEAEVESIVAEAIEWARASP